MEAKPTVQDSRRSLKYTPEVFEKHAEAQQALWFLYSNVYTVSQKMKLRRIEMVLAAWLMLGY